MISISIEEESWFPKRGFLVLLFAPLLLVFSTGVAQSKKLPSFRMVTANGKVFNAWELPMSKPIVLFYFSPDCDHCKTMMRDYITWAKEFEKASVVMVTYLPLEKVARFSQEYKTLRYPNLFMGTEGTGFFVRDYYEIKTMPFVAVHDRNGNLIKTYSSDIPLPDIAAILKRMN